MAQAPINKPILVASSKQWPHTRALVGDGSNAFEGQQFVKLASGNLAENASGDTVCYGLSVTGSATAAQVAASPQAYPFQEQQGVVDVDEATFLVNINSSASTLNANDNQLDVALGTAYNINVHTTGDYAGYAFLNPAATNAAFFRVEQLWAEDASNDTNGRVIVSFAGTRQ